MRTREGTVVVLVGLLVALSALAGCSSSSGSSAIDAWQELPPIILTDVASGEPVEVASVADPSRPTLVWIWAPF